ncbi:MAG TPA: tetratricopeptide repeat protein [Gemmatimonadaceae bacterium]|nr:tetratricopeptide repeat protein [Gemmatimonadaceae bacterium]
MMLQSMRHAAAFKAGRMLLRLQRWRAAELLLRRATALAPTDWESHNNLAIALLKTGRWEEACGMAQRAIRLAPAAADAHDIFGITLLQMERWEEAVVAYRRAIAVDATRYDLHDRLGMALMRLERWEDVVATYDAALRADPSRYVAHQRQGIALQRLRQWAAAAAAFGRAIDVAEQNHAPRADLDVLRLSVEEVHAQIDAAKQSGVPQVALHPNTEAHLLRGVEFLVRERWSEAAAELAKGSTYTPELAGLHFLRVDALMRLGRLTDAVASHQTALGAKGALPPLPGRTAAQRFTDRQATFWTAKNLRPEVFAIERWLEQLSVAAPARDVTSGARLLFVLDNDFGELTTVKYLLLGQQQLAGRTTLLLPARLYAHNADAIPGRTHQYATVDEILAVVDRERIDIVCLCSGYLLWEHLKFTTDDLVRLVDQLRERGCRVVTADPFLGLLSQRDPSTVLRVDIPDAHGLWSVEQLEKAKRSAEERMWTGFAESERVLRHTWHLYPSYCDVADDAAAETDARNLAFFNDRLLWTRPVAPDDTVLPHWLFILGGPDWDIQLMFEGEAFVDVMARKLIETRAAGRHPILIAPKEFIEKLMPRMPTADGIDILAFCPFPRFMSLLLSAEHAFYWNMVSHSLLFRLFNGLPIVQFDRGHLLRIAPPIRDRIVAWYYQGWEPPLRDHHEPLTLETVEAWAADYRQQADRLTQRYRRAPSPEAMTADLMRAAATPMQDGDVSVRDSVDDSRGPLRSGEVA